MLLAPRPAHAQGALFGYDFSGNLILQTNENAGLPLILGQPQVQIVRLGESAAFSVVVADSDGLSYQWRFDGTNIAGATGDAVTLLNVSALNEGAYDVVLVNGAGSVTSSPAILWIDANGNGMPDRWENATGSNPSVDDAMTKASDGYALVEHYINWLADPHASTMAGASVDIDLSAYAAGFASVSPTYTVSAAQNGTVALAADKKTAQFLPTAGFHGLGSFTFTVTGSDSTKYTDEVVVLVAP